MTDLLEVVFRLEQNGGTLVLAGDRIRYSIPKDDAEAPGLLAELRRRRDEVTELLRKRANWPSESQKAEQRFGQPHAKLFPFIGRKVRTPEGSGTLLQVFADRVTVLLDSEQSRCSFFPPGRIEPINWESPE